MTQKIISHATAVTAMCAFLYLIAFPNAAQDQRLREEYQAQAMGQGTQLGRTFNETLIIEEYSSPEERQVLVEAFEKAGSQGQFNALNKMHAKGHIPITGTLGSDVVFARKIPNPDGSIKIRVLTNHPIPFGEAWTNSRSMDYNLSAFELDIDKELRKGSGILLSACQFKIDKTNELVIENYQNPWKLVDIQDRSKG